MNRLPETVKRAYRDWQNASPEKRGREYVMLQTVIAAARLPLEPTLRTLRNGR